MAGVGGWMAAFRCLGGGWVQHSGSGTPHIPQNWPTSKHLCPPKNVGFRPARFGQPCTGTFPYNRILTSLTVRITMTGLAYGSPLVCMPECRTQQAWGFSAKLRGLPAIYTGSDTPQTLCCSKGGACVNWSGRTVLRIADTHHNLQISKVITPTSKMLRWIMN